MKTLIAVPCMDSLPTDFATSLMDLKKGEDVHYAVTKNSLIYDSRNAVAANAITAGHMDGDEGRGITPYDRVLWIDSDMKFDPDMLVRLSEDMDQGLDYVAGIFFVRKIPTYPVVYSEIRYYTDESNQIHAEAVKMRYYPKDQLFRCGGTGFGAVMTSVKLLKDVWDRFGPPFQPLSHMGEDLSFCWRVNQLGREMYCDSRVKVGHIGQFVFDENVYLNQQATRTGGDEE